MGARCYNATLGRFDGADALAGAAPGWSQYRYAFNNPVAYTDPDGNFERNKGWNNASKMDIRGGLSSNSQTEPCDDCTFDGGLLPTVTVSAKRGNSSRNHDQSPVRYGFNGSFEEWGETYGYFGSYENARNYWYQVHSKDFDRYVIEQDEAEAARIAVEKMKMFVFLISTSGSMGIGTISPTLTATRGFHFSSPISSNSGAVGRGVLKPLGLGSTGRTAPASIREQLAMKEIMSNPTAGRVLIQNMKDASGRWNGWSKMSNKTAHGVEIHYNALWENGVIKAIDDFKFISP